MPIVNTNKQYHNKAIHNTKCTTDHLNILQCNIQGFGSIFERIDKLITTQIASGYDPDILHISETLTDNSTLLKLHRPNWHFELHTVATLKLVHFRYSNTRIIYGSIDTHQCL